MKRNTRIQLKETRLLAFQYPEAKAGKIPKLPELKQIAGGD